MGENIKISTKKVNVFYGDKKALENISLEIPEKKETFINLCITYFKSLILENTSFTI